MSPIAAGVEISEFPESIHDNGQPVNWRHLAVASLVMMMTACTLSAFTHLLLA